MHDATYTQVPIANLRPHPRNARTHSKKQIKLVARSIREAGFLSPVLVDETMTIIAGHARVEAAKQLGLAAVPTLRFEHMTEAQKRAYVIADNRLAELAGWDKSILAEELSFLIETEFEVDLTGFSMAEADLIIGAEADKKVDPLEERIPNKPTAPVSRPGDTWLLGEHRIHCGSALDAESYVAVLAGRRTGVVFTDPPYNVPIRGHVSGLGKVEHREFAMGVGEMSRAEFVRFLATSLGHAAAHSSGGAVHFVCMDWRHLGELQEAGDRVYGALLNLCVWDKGTGGMGSLYRSQHELVLVYRVGQAAHRNNVELGRNGRNRTNVWAYRGLAGFGRDRDEALALHPTVKPVGLVADALLDVSKRGDVVLDPFSGSGTTLLAAEKTGRKAAVIELDPGYVDVAIARYEKATGKLARHAVTGGTFEAVAESRDREALASGDHVSVHATPRDAASEEAA